MIVVIIHSIAVENSRPLQ